MMNPMISDRLTLLTSNSQANHDLSFLQIIDLIADTLGIHIQPQHQDGFKKSILTRIKGLGLPSFNDYYIYLITQRQLLSDVTEWQWLVSLLSVTESYFFRDQGQFWLLRNQILPEMIEHKRQLSLTHNDVKGQLYRPTLRFWSAGCSTGEEAYSLAILLKELIPDHQAWDILILGTDINQSAIALARQGIYSDWSFRTTDPMIKNHYFRSHRKGWEIDPSIRQMVTFQPGNLVQDSYPSYDSRIYNLDLIFCRNVFIYFDFPAIGLVLEKFYRSLAPDGFLFTGHTELHGQKTEPFQLKSFPQSVVYQRLATDFGANETDKPERKPLNSSVLHPLPIDSPCMKSPSPLPSLDEDLGVKEATQQTLLDKVQRSLTQKAYVDASQIAKQLVSLAPQHFQAYCLMAEAYANLGEYSHATQACQQALQINPLAIEPYYLLAQIAEEQSDINSAKFSLKRIIYLVPKSVSAYLELGSIYEREGNAKQAQKTWRSLLEVLQSLPQEQAVTSSNPQTIAELKSHLLKHLGMIAKNSDF
ncbi:CheR family methyltransferase [Leptolyngbyaceae cyanobacterium UHCC 1019]